MTASDFAGMPHIVIITSETSIKTVTFTGKDSVLDAHRYAVEQADGDKVITVAVRIRQIYQPAMEYLAC